MDRCRAQDVSRVEFIHRTATSAALAEQYVEGREIYVSMMGNERVTYRLGSSSWRPDPQDHPCSRQVAESGIGLSRPSRCHGQPGPNQHLTGDRPCRPGLDNVLSAGFKVCGVAPWQMKAKFEECCFGQLA